MAERNQKVYDRVRQELEKNPSLGSRELYGIIQGVDKGMGDSLQQFHARYVLPAKREKKGGGSAAAARPAGGRGRRGRRQTEAAAEPKERKPRGRRGGRAGAATPEAGGQSGAQAGGGLDRERVRSVLLQFAQELTDAESRSSLVKVLGRVDTYVDRIAGAGR